MTDLFEYPADHVGTRHYVSVRGYSRSIPRYKTFRGTDGYNRVLPEFGGVEQPYTSDSPFIMPDKQPYVSPMDGSYITSRSAHREHMRKHNAVECGDRPVGELKPQQGRKLSGRDIADVIRSLGGH
jgi:hypothetical protein